MNRHLAYGLAFALFLVSGMEAHAANCSAYPYTLTNGTTADANQVMADFNNILDCGNNNLLGKNNNLSDVQSASTSRTNLGLGAAAVENLSNSTAGAVVDDGSGNLVISSYPTLHSQTFSSSGTFSIPASATSATQFEFTVIGGGAGGGGGYSGTNSATSGASGGAIVATFHGFTAGGSVTVSVGGGGSGGASGVKGGAGSASTLTYSATAIVTANGGQAPSNVQSQSLIGTTATSVGATGLTLDDSHGCGAQNGTNGSFGAGNFGANGGSNCIGSGGVGADSLGDASGAGTFGGGGGAGASPSTTAGADGGNGVVVVRWVL